MISLINIIFISNFIISGCQYNKTPIVKQSVSENLVRFQNKYYDECEDYSHSEIEELFIYCRDNNLLVKQTGELFYGFYYDLLFYPVKYFEKQNITAYIAGNGWLVFDINGQYGIYDFFEFTPRILMPEIYCEDINNDGNGELIVCYCTGTGTSYETWDVCIIEFCNGGNIELEQENQLHFIKSTDIISRIKDKVNGFFPNEITDNIRFADVNKFYVEDKKLYFTMRLVEFIDDIPVLSDEKLIIEFSFDKFNYTFSQMQ